MKDLRRRTAPSKTFSNGKSTATARNSKLFSPRIISVSSILFLLVLCFPFVHVANASPIVVATIPVGSSPVGVAYDSGKGEVFVTNQGSNTVSVISDGSQQCQESDGNGNFQGQNGNGNFNSDNDGCQDGDQNQVSSTNRGDGQAFQSTQISSAKFDLVAKSVTITGIGTTHGLPVTFVFVAQETGPTTPGWVSFAFSDGYTNSGILANGSILLH